MDLTPENEWFLLYKNRFRFLCLSVRPPEPGKAPFEEYTKLRAASKAVSNGCAQLVC